VVIPNADLFTHSVIVKHRRLTFADVNNYLTVKAPENFEELRSVIINAVKRVAGVLFRPQSGSAAREFGRSQARILLSSGFYGGPSLLVSTKC